MRRIALATTLAALVVLAGCIGGSSSESMGLAAGGAQDVNDFRNNVDEGYVPQPSSLTAEGLYHDHYFDTGQNRPCNATFCPSYSRAVTRDPLSGERERYVTVGLNSGIDADEFERKALNLVVVVDTSGSMSDGFGSYYYDDDGTRKTVEDDDRSKMAAARDAVGTLTTHLTDDDRIGVVGYDDEARTVVEMGRVGDRDMGAVRERIDGLRAGGSTNLDDAMRSAESMVEPYRNPDRTEHETRVVYVTDAMPNTGTTDGQTLGERLSSNADAGVYSTFVGVGVDFNARFVETVNGVEGANHYVVRSPDQFAERMNEGFEHMVTPLVFDLSVELESDAYRIERVYGSPNANASSGDLLHVNTLFPSRTEDGKTEGGVVLVELERVENATASDDGPALTARYETRDGTRHETTRTVEFASRDAPYYESTGVRKAVLLGQYVDLLRNWMAHERARATDGEVDAPAAGIEHRTLGEWEQTSIPLRVSATYRDRIREFRAHFVAESAALGDERLQRERDVLDTLATHGTNETNATATDDIPSTDANATTAADANATTSSATAALGTPGSPIATPDHFHPALRTFLKHPVPRSV
ncbi:VWA domain-containing protein [Halorubellus sp. JP-L1]|uniref:vWA domain-containing protein n=1 Tax=Halorubellus sp. JP-L1 TaxID=2715753 RepID=UPI0014079AA6|nr:VWA domain-containing protein [Halorubellus sp. JP-L1]NHN41791.1 VWA domain-containing protein [Halorubellus sp. JP-L1]